MSTRAGSPLAKLDIMAGGKRVRLEVTCGRQQLLELDLLVADYAWNWRLAGRIAVSERLHDCRFEALFVVEDVVRNAEPVGDAAGIVDVLSGAAGTAPPDSLAMVIKLQGDADDFAPLLLEQRSNDRRIDATRHRHDHPSRAASRRALAGRRYLTRGHGHVLADSGLTKIPALCPSPSAAAIWPRVEAQSRRKQRPAQVRAQIRAWMPLTGRRRPHPQGLYRSGTAFDRTSSRSSQVMKG